MVNGIGLEQTLPARDEVKIKRTLKGSNEYFRNERSLTIMGTKGIEKTNGYELF